jgi:hypothetical protein
MNPTPSPFCAAVGINDTDDAFNTLALESYPRVILPPPLSPSDLNQRCVELGITATHNTSYKPNMLALEWALQRTAPPATLSSCELILRDIAIKRVAQIAGGLTFEDGRTPNVGSARDELKALLREISYEPDAKDIGTIKDLRTNVRLNLILETQIAMAHGWGAARRGFDPAIRLVYPAWEFKRVFFSRAP